MTSDVLNKIKNLRNSSKDLPNFDQLLLLLLVELCGLSAGVYILNYITGKESDISSDSEALDIINDPLVHYINDTLVPIEKLKEVFKNNSTVTGLVEYLEQNKGLWTY